MSDRSNSVLINIGLCLLAILVGVGAFSALAARRKPPPKRVIPEKTFNVQVFRVAPSTVREIVTGFGTAVSEQETDYSASVSGEVMEVSDRLKVGESVTGRRFHDATESGSASRFTDGDLLLTIDREVYLNRKAQAESAYEEAQAELATLDQEDKNSLRLLEKAKRDFETSKADHARMERLRKDGTVTDNEVSLSLLEMRRYERVFVEAGNVNALIPVRKTQINKKLNRLEIEKRLAEIDVDRTEVTPPFSGIVSEVSVEKGQYVQPGTVLFRITRINKVEVALPLHPLDYAKIADLVLNGQEPIVHLAENETAISRWQGRVIRVAPKADFRTRTINVFVEVENDRHEVPLLPGMFVQARIEGPILENRVLIPREAVTSSGSHKGRAFIERDGRAKGVSISIQRKLEGMAFVSAGVAPGDRLILTNLDVITDGALVDVRSERTVAEELENAQTLRPFDSASAESMPDVDKPLLLPSGS